MIDNNQLDTCVALFTNWQQPWKFKQFCQAKLKPDPDLLNQFEAMYENAQDRLLWPDSQVSENFKDTSHIVATLEIAFPGFKIETYEAIIRAVSYEWR